MNYNIYNLYPAMRLVSGINIHLQNICLSHTYSGLLCGVPNEIINNEILHDINEIFNESIFVIEPEVTMISENEFFGRDNTQDDTKIIPLLEPVKVHALFECYEGNYCSFLNIVWFQDDFSITIPGAIKKKIKEIDWYRYSSRLLV